MKIKSLSNIEFSNERRRYTVQSTLIIDRSKNDPSIIKKIKPDSSIKKLEIIAPEIVPDYLQKKWLEEPIDLTPISELTHLEKIVIHGGLVRNLEPLSSCSQIRVINLILYNEQLDISPLSECEKLEDLEISKTPFTYIDLTPLDELQRLKWLRILNCGLVGLKLTSNLNVEFIELNGNRIISKYSMTLRGRGFFSEYRKVRSQIEKLSKSVKQNQLLDLTQIGSSNRIFELNLANNNIIAIDLSELIGIQNIPRLTLNKNELIYICDEGIEWMPKDTWKLGISPPRSIQSGIQLIDKKGKARGEVWRRGWEFSRR